MIEPHSAQLGASSWILNATFVAPSDRVTVPMPLPFDDLAAWPLEATTASSSRAGEEDPLPSLAVAAGVTALTAAAVPLFDPACSPAGSIPLTEAPPTELPLGSSPDPAGVAPPAAGGGSS